MEACKVTICGNNETLHLSVESPISLLEMGECGKRLSIE